MIKNHLAQANSALSNQDLQGAMDHLGLALMEDPSSHEGLQLLSDIAGQSSDPFKLLNSKQPRHLCCRAYLLGSQGSYEEALSIMADIAPIRPHVNLLTWLYWWLQPQVINSLGDDILKQKVIVPIMKTTTSCPPLMKEEDPRYSTILTAAHIMHAISGALPNEALVYTTISIIGRRLGTLDEALVNAQYAHQLKPTWHTSVSIANIFRDMKDIDQAAAMFREALKLDPKDHSALLDLGDTFLEAERWTDAQGAYQEVLSRKQNEPWAKASLLYLKYKIEKDENARKELLLLRDKGENHRALDLANEIDPERPFINWLPRGGDATCNATRDVFEKMYHNPVSFHGSIFELKLSHLESPSVLWAAFPLQMEMWGPNVGIELHVETIQTPDPRQPKAQMPYLLWKYEEYKGVPAIPKPQNRELEWAIQELAEKPFHLEWNVPDAKAIAKRFGTGALNDLLGFMVHPPRPPNSDWRVLVWVQRIQVCVALIIAHLDQGWANSYRKNALLSMVYGPVDWTVDAGIIALGVIARNEPETRGEIIQIFQWLRSQIPTDGFTCYEYPLCSTMLAFENQDPAAIKDLEKWKANILSGKTGNSLVISTEFGAKKFNQEEEIAKAQEAQAKLNSGEDNDPDPTLFPGKPVAKLSDYVRLLKGMQSGDMMGALNQFGLSMATYAPVMTEWGQKLQSDPTLNAKMAKLMQL